MASGCGDPAEGARVQCEIARLAEPLSVCLPRTTHANRGVLAIPSDRGATRAMAPDDQGPRARRALPHHARISGVDAARSPGRRDARRNRAAAPEVDPVSDRKSTRLN